jgi:hypothetical protein
MIHDGEIKVEYIKKRIIKELKCIICYNLPVDPLQCQGCDTIICRSCTIKLGRYKCPIRCTHQNINEIKPKTRLLYEGLTLKYRGCNAEIALLSFNKHLKICKMDVLSISNLATFCETSFSVGLEVPKQIISNSNSNIKTRSFIWYLKTSIIGMMALFLMLTSTYFCIYTTFINKSEYKILCVSYNIYTIVGLDSV